MEMQVEQMMAHLLAEIRTNQEMLCRMEAKIDINLKEIKEMRASQALLKE
jgi:hypothetical protein